MRCDKADCNFYDSNMEYNCAWGNDGSSSIMCMTHDYKRYCQRPLTSKSGYIEGVNYKKLYEHEKNLLALSEARFRAAEEAFKTKIFLSGHSLVDPVVYDRYEKLVVEWQSAIAAYDKAKGGK